MGNLTLLQGIFPTQGLNWGLLHCRWILYQLSYQGSPHARKVMLRIHHTKFQQYVNQELPDVQAGFRKGRGREVTQSCLTLCDAMDCSLPGSSIHGIFQARVLEWAAISFSRGRGKGRGTRDQIANICWITEKAREFQKEFSLASCCCC